MVLSDGSDQPHGFMRWFCCFRSDAAVPGADGGTSRSPGTAAAAASASPSAAAAALPRPASRPRHPGQQPRQPGPAVPDPRYPAAQTPPREHTLTSSHTGTWQHIFRRLLQNVLCVIQGNQRPAEKNVASVIHCISNKTKRTSGVTTPVFVPTKHSLNERRGQKDIYFRQRAHFGQEGQQQQMSRCHCDSLHFAHTCWFIALSLSCTCSRRVSSSRTRVGCRARTRCSCTSS